MDELRILTVRQPWAHAITHLGKDVENRTRNIAGGYRGPVAIHAAKQRLPIEADLAAGAFIGARTGFRPLFTMPTGLGSIVGVVDLVQVHHADWCWDGGQTCSTWADDDVFHLLLANPRPLAEPIPYKGALGLRILPADVAAQVWAGVAA